MERAGQSWSVVLANLLSGPFLSDVKVEQTGAWLAAHSEVCFYVWTALTHV